MDVRCLALFFLKKGAEKPQPARSPPYFEVGTQEVANGLTNSFSKLLPTDPSIHHFDADNHNYKFQKSTTAP